MVLWKERFLFDSLLVKLPSKEHLQFPAIHDLDLFLLSLKQMLHYFYDDWLSVKYERV